MGSPEIFVVSVTGKKIKSQLVNKGTDEVALDIKDLRPGVYFVQIINGPNRISQKFVKL